MLLVTKYMILWSYKQAHPKKIVCQWLLKPIKEVNCISYKWVCDVKRVRVWKQ